MTPEPTTRAYTVRLDQAADANWRNHVWTTHLTVNRGVWTWGDWLLSLRGSLPASLIENYEINSITDDLVAKELKKRNLKGDAARIEVRKSLEDSRVQAMRVMLAVSWLSVESPESLCPKDHVIARGDDDPKKRIEKIKSHFAQILKDKKATQRDEWLAACEPALSARIRSDAVWVDRTACFKDLQQELGSKFTVDWASTTFLDLIGGEKDYFAMPDIDGAASSEAKDFVIKAGNWLSRNWGSGKKSEAGVIVDALEKLCASPKRSIVGKSGINVVGRLLEELGQESNESDPEKLLKQLKQAIGWKGRSSKGAVALEKLIEANEVDGKLWESTCGKLQEDIVAQSVKLKNSGKAPVWMPKLREQIEDRIGMPFRTSKDHIWEYAVMLDHALRRLSSAHSWVKRAEVQRSKFKEAAEQIFSIPQEVCRLLDKYCEDRSSASGAAEEYLIRKRALEGWDKVVAKWGTKKCETFEHRIQAVREMQGEIEKFGDAQLFEALATENYTGVWRNEKNKTQAELLKNYAEARTAQHDQRRFKVPAYRHPDPLRNPVWTDFGNSRWGISYSALETVRKRKSLIEKLKTAKTETAKRKIEAELAEILEKNLKQVSLGLWCSEAVTPVPLQWRSKRLSGNLALPDVYKEGTSVTRADRLGRAVAGVNGEAVTVAEVFEQNDWSGRLQANRGELDRLADLVYGKKGEPQYKLFNRKFPERAFKRLQGLRWLLSYSAKLLPAGPLFDELLKSKEYQESGWKYAKGRSGYYFQHPANEGRKGRGRLILARMPGLRILSFDLGHRYAAACAVWLTLTEKQLKKAIADRKIVAGGVSAKDLYVHTQHESADGKSKKTIYRRLGPDMWACLERQFVIKLQGEDHSARRATQKEIEAFVDHATALGHVNDQVLVKNKRIDELMTSAADTLKRALRRHGDIARIANAFQTGIKHLAGGKTYNFFEPNPGLNDDSPEKRAENYQQFLADALVLWRELNDRRWQNVKAQDLWNRHIVPLLENITVEVLPEEESPLERKARIKRLGKTLEPVAAQIAKDKALRSRLATEFTKMWQEEDAAWLGEEGHLRWLRRLVLPRIGIKPPSDSKEFKIWKERLKEIRHVGGLRIERLATITKLYQIQRAYYSRPKPDNTRAGIDLLEKGSENGDRFGKRIIDALEYLRQNRIKQLASRLVEAALGVGSESKKHWERGRKRPQQQVFPTCHVIVGEDLDNYRPEQTRLRSENKRLRDWCARNVRKLVMEGCQLHGLHFLEVDPRYTSRQDSRTGLPGVRCTEANVQKLLSRNDFKKARERVKKKNGVDTRDLMIDALFAKYESNSADQIIRITQGGGELFVSSDENAKGAIQADLNAAANIGLKALLDPDWPGAWWYIPVKYVDGTTDPKDFPSCPLFELPLKLLEDNKVEDEDAKRAKGDRVNAWRDITGKLLAEKPFWLHTPAYWKWVEKRVLQKLADSQSIKLNKTS